VKKGKTLPDFPNPAQRKYAKPDSDLGSGTAIPRSTTEFDLEPVYSKTRIGVNDEQTFRVPKRGNKP